MLPSTTPASALLVPENPTTARALFQLIEEIETHTGLAPQALPRSGMWCFAGNDLAVVMRLDPPGMQIVIATVAPKTGLRGTWRGAVTPTIVEEFRKTDQHFLIRVAQRAQPTFAPDAGIWPPFAPDVIWRPFDARGFRWCAFACLGYNLAVAAAFTATRRYVFAHLGVISQAQTGTTRHADALGDLRIWLRPQAAWLLAGHALLTQMLREPAARAEWRALTVVAGHAWFDLFLGAANWLPTADARINTLIARAKHVYVDSDRHSQRTHALEVGEQRRQAQAKLAAILCTHAHVIPDLRRGNSVLPLTSDAACHTSEEKEL